MSKFVKVVVIGHLLRNNTVAKSGDVVETNKLVNLQASLKGNFVVPCDKDGKLIEEETTEEVVALDEMKKDQLKAYIRENQYDIDEDQNKSDLLKAIKEVEANTEE